MVSERRHGADSFRGRLLKLAEDYANLEQENGRLREALKNGEAECDSALSLSVSTPCQPSSSDDPRLAPQRMNAFEREHTFASEGNESSHTSSTGVSSKTRKTVFLKKQVSFSDLHQSSSFRIGLRKIVSHSFFERFTGAVILLNVIYMGWSAESEMVNWRVPRETQVDYIELAFCATYTTELAMRIVSFGSRFANSPDRAWNALDALLVVQNLFEQITVLSSASTGIGNLSFLRMMRLLKMVKMIRIIRLMRSMRELRLILFAIMGSMRSMFWSLSLLATVVYMFSIIFVQYSAAHLQTSHQSVSSEMLADYQYFFGHMPTGMCTLFMTTTGGIEWNRVADLLWEVGPIFYLMFIFYIAFFVFVLVNTVTALFVENTIQNANQDIMNTVHLELEKKQGYIKQLQVMFEGMDENEDGLISLEEFKNHMHDPKMAAFASSLDIQIRDASHFFLMISEGGAKNVDPETFVEGCIRLKGLALAVDLQALSMRQMQFMNDQSQFALNSNLCLSRINEMCNAMLDHVASQVEEVKQVSDEICSRAMPASIDAFQGSPLVFDELQGQRAPTLCP